MGRTSDGRTRIKQLRATVIGLSVIAATFVGSAPALGSTVGVLTGALSYTAGAGEANSVTVNQAGLFHRVSDSGAAISPGLGCVSVLPSVVDCLGVLSLGLDTGDGDDTVQVFVPTVSTINGGGGGDVLIGNSGIDVLNGGDGDDVIDGGIGADLLNGGSGTDTVSYAQRSAPVTVDPDGVADDGQSLELDTVGSDIENLIGGSDDDTLTGSAGPSLLTGNDGEDTLNGGDGDDTLNGNDDGDILNGGVGADTLDGGLGGDTLIGGFDVDSVSYAGRTNDLTVTLDNVANDGESGENDDVRSDIQNVTGGSGDDSISGSSGSNSLSGGIGDDTLDGGIGSDVLNGGGGVDAVSYALRSAVVTVDLDGIADDGESGENDIIGADIEDVLGGLGPDTITGNSVANALTGGAGNDTLEGGEGADVLFGGAGDDLLRSRDTVADDVGCGSESDSAIADLLDLLDADCETIDNGTDGGTPGGGGSTGGGGTGGGGTGGGTPGGGTGTGTVVIPPNPLTATKTGVVGVALRCQGTGTCAGTVAVETARRVRLAGQRRARKIALGSYQFSSRAASSTTVRVKLPARLRRLLKRKKLLLRVTALTRDSAGKPVTVTRTIVVKARRARA